MRKFRWSPQFSIVEDRHPYYGIHGTPCGFFFSWLGLILWVANVRIIAGMDRWEFRSPTKCEFIQQKDQ
jgi:hypothetical protein